MRRAVAGSLLTVPLLVAALASPAAAATGRHQPPHRHKPKVVVRCLGLRATVVVTAKSPHVVRGTSHRDVVAVLVPGHVVQAGAGNDVV